MLRFIHSASPLAVCACHLVPPTKARIFLGLVGASPRKITSESRREQEGNNPRWRVRLRNYRIGMCLARIFFFVSWSWALFCGGWIVDRQHGVGAVPTRRRASRGTIDLTLSPASPSSSSFVLCCCRRCLFKRRPAVIDWALFSKCIELTINAKQHYVRL